MAKHEFKETLTNHWVFVKKYDGGDFIILLLYVNDMLINGHDLKIISALKEALRKSFAKKDLESAEETFEMKITRDRSKKSLWLSQESYVETLLERLNMHKAKPITTQFAGHFKLCKAKSNK